MNYYYSSKKTSAYKPLEHYGIIGNLETCALTGADGSIDWLCLPHLESPSLFGRLLDAAKGGYFQIRPKDNFKSYQTYVDRTNILETHFSSSAGKAVLTDFMPPFKKRQSWHKHQVLFRKLKCLGHRQTFTVTFHPAFNYARNKCKLSSTNFGIAAHSGKQKVFLDGPQPFKIKGQSGSSQITLKPGEEIFLVMQFNNHNVYSFNQASARLKATAKFWHKWAHNCQKDTCVFKGPWHGLVVRSGLLLKLLTHGETGSIAAAATTSLPETLGGVRNWDYRFNWIRDSVFTTQALYNLGHVKEARQLFNWYKRIYKGADLKQVQIMIGLHGQRQLPEKPLWHLSGYKNSRPVRIGNKAASQRQLDIYGELLNMAYETTRFGDSISGRDWDLLKKIVNHVGRVWQKKDAGLWEVRIGYRHYVYSKVMCWVAVDRGIKIAEKKGFAAPFPKWLKLREDIRKTILEKGYNKKLNSFVQFFGSTALDASNLLIPLVDFLPLRDSRVQGTIVAVKKYLTKGGLVARYNSGDGLPGSEGRFILCTYWLIDALALSGQIAQAEKLFKNLLKLASPLGLFSEEVDLTTRQQLGNFPQAFSHIGLINTTLYLGLAKGHFKPSVKPVGPVENMDLLHNKFMTVFKVLNN